MKVKVIVWHDDGTKQEILFPNATGLSQSFADDRTVLDIFGRGETRGAQGSW